MGQLGVYIAIGIAETSLAIVSIIVFKRGKGTGYAGIENPLFFKPNTSMFYGDASKSVQALLNSITELGDSFGDSVSQANDEEEVEKSDH